VATELAPGVWTWRLEHPDWAPGDDFEPEVACYAVHTPSAALLIDALWPDDDEDWLDAFVAHERVLAAVLKPDHVREASELAHAYGGRVVTNADVAGLLGPAATVSVLEVGEEIADGMRFLADGRGRGETPLWIPTARAVAFADAVRGDPEQGGLRVWSYPPGREAATRAALEDVVAREPEHVLVGHGAPVIGGGAAALREALERPPWVTET
jgi:hypothetical protein